MIAVIDVNCTHISLKYLVIDEVDVSLINLCCPRILAVLDEHCLAFLEVHVAFMEHCLAFLEAQVVVLEICVGFLELHMVLSD